MFRFSLRWLLGLVTAVCIAFTLTRMHFVVSGVVLAILIAASSLVGSCRAWRCIAYGSVAGILAGQLLMLVYMAWEQSRLPANSFGNFAQIDTLRAWRPYMVHFGALTGAWVAWALFGKPTAKESSATAQL